MSIFRRQSPESNGAPTVPATPTGTTPAGTPGVSPLATPPAPKPERLDRNKLTILASFAGMGVIGMVIFIQPSSPNSGGVRAEAPPTQAGTYLDQPLRRAVPPPSPAGTSGAVTPYGAAGASAGDYGAGAAGVGQSAAAGQAAAGPNLAPGYAPLPASPEPYPQPYPAPGAYANGTYPGAAGGAYGVPAAPPPTAAELRAAAYRRALDASPTGEAPPLTVADRSAGPASNAGIVAGVGDGEVVAGGGSAAPAATSAGAVTRADQFMQTAALAGGQRTVQALTVQAAPGAFSIQAGTVIPAVLMTEINSDLPGECLAQITRDVYDSRAQRFLLIPRGSKLLCRYDDQLTTGQSRLLVAWTRILLPDGRSVSLPGLPATDAAGARGVSDQVDRHAKRAFGTAAALSLIGAGVQLSQPQRGSVFAPPSAGQVMAGALGQELNQVSVEMLRRDLANRQTIRIRQGVEFNVFLNTDLTFPGPYATTRTDGGAAAAQTTAAVDRFGRLVPVARRDR